MKKKIFTLFAAAVCIAQAQAQTTQVVDISTGIVNGSTTHISYGTNDDTWTVQEPGGSTFIHPITVHPHSGWAGSYHAEWITPELDWFGDIAELPVSDYTYKTTFTTTDCPVSATLNLREYAADNKLTSININGHAHTFSALFNSLSGPTTINITGELVSGTNTITAVVNNTTPGDLSGVGPSVTGLLIYGDISITYPTLSISGASFFCKNDPISFAVTANTNLGYTWSIAECNSSGSIVSGGYSWSQSYSGTPGNYSFPVYPNCNSYYKVTLSANLACGRAETTSSVIFINCLPIPEAGPNDTICLGDCKTIGNFPQSHVSYQWVTNSGHSTVVIGHTAQITVCPTAAATTYTLMATNSAGCMASDEVTIYTTTTNPSFSLSNNTSNPSYYTVTATPNVLSPSAGTAYAWIVEDLNSSGNDIFIIDNPSIWWTFPGTPSNVFQGFDGSYPYTPAPTHVTSLPSSPSVGKFLYNHNYRITRATWDNNCPWKTFSQLLTVTKSLGNGQPQVLVTDDPVGPDMSVLANLVTGNANSVDTKAPVDAITVYPNPGTGLFTISVSQSSTGLLEVYDVLGNKVQSIVINANTSDYKLDLSGHSKGIYMLNMISGDQRYAKKIILE